MPSAKRPAGPLAELDAELSRLNDMGAYDPALGDTFQARLLGAVRTAGSLIHALGERSGDPLIGQVRGKIQELDRLTQVTTGWQSEQVLQELVGLLQSHEAVSALLTQPKPGLLPTADKTSIGYSGFVG